MTKKNWKQTINKKQYKLRRMKNMMKMNHKRRNNKNQMKKELRDLPN